MSRDYELLMEKIENAYTRLRALKNAVIKYENGEVPWEIGRASCRERV